MVFYLSFLGHFFFLRSTEWPLAGRDYCFSLLGLKLTIKNLHAYVCICQVNSTITAVEKLKKWNIYRKILTMQSMLIRSPKCKSRFRFLWNLFWFSLDLHNLWLFLLMHTELSLTSSINGWIKWRKSINLFLWQGIQKNANSQCLPSRKVGCPARPPWKKKRYGAIFLLNFSCTLVLKNSSVNY